MLPKRNTQNKTVIQTNLVSALNKVNNAPKYQPSVVLPQLSVLKQKILLVESLVKQGKITPNPNDKMLRNKDDLWNELKKVKEQGIFAWDTEFDNLRYDQANLVGLSFYNYEEDSSFYVPFIHCDSSRNILENQMTYKDFTEVAGEIFEDQKIKKVSHQYNSCDNQVLAYNTGIFVKGQYWDTLLFMNAIDENRLSGNGLKQLYSELVLNESGSQDTYENLFGDLSFAFVPLDVAYVYGCKDSRMTGQVQLAQKKLLSAPEYKKMLQHYIEVEAPQLEVVNKMQYRGITLNDNTVKALHDEYSELLNSIKDEMDKYFFMNFGLKNINYRSTQQMQKIIYDHMKCESVDRKSPRGTGEEIIGRLVHKYPQYVILKKLLTYRSVEKLLNTYIDALPPQRSPKDNALRGRFFSHGARTGRYSSSEPNLQNIPSGFNKETQKDDSRIRNMFVPREGYVWISADFSQIEPRILAYRSDDYIMLDAYNTGKDLYSLMASSIYNVSYEDCLEKNGSDAKRRRSSVKSVLLGLMYGRQAKSIGEQIGLNTKQAEQFIDNFFHQYPNIKQYIDETIRLGTLLGYVTTIYDRRRRLVDLNSQDEYRRAEAQRQAVNASINMGRYELNPITQGCAA
jgi:DNA polymerase-1